MCSDLGGIQTSTWTSPSYTVRTRGNEHEVQCLIQSSLCMSQEMSSFCVLISSFCRIKKGVVRLSSDTVTPKPFKRSLFFLRGRLPFFFCDGGQGGGNNNLMLVQRSTAALALAGLVCSADAFSPALSIASTRAQGMTRPLHDLTHNSYICRHMRIHSIADALNKY